VSAPAFEIEITSQGWPGADDPDLTYDPARIDVQREAQSRERGANPCARCTAVSSLPLLSVIRAGRV